MRTGFLTLVYGLMLNFSVHAAPFDNNNTHTTAVPEQSFQLAATWFLPDWQASSSSRSETAPSGSGDIPIECKNYSPSCSTPKILGGKKVRIGNIFCSIECVCPSSYATTECDPEYTLIGSPCTYNGINYYQGCNPRPCSDKGADYFATKQTNLKCSEVTYGGRTCYQCVNPCSGLTDHKEDENCKAFGCKEEYGDGCSYCKTCYTDGCHNYPNAIAVKDTTYGCEEDYDDCSSKCQTPYEDNCHTYTNGTTNPLVDNCSEGCAKDETANNCNSKCKNGCRAKCNTGYKLNINETGCVEESCPTGYDTEVTKCGDGYDLKTDGQSGTLACNKCVAKTACTAGSTSCNSTTQNATANGYYVGDSPCYTCTAKTCAQMGKKDCNGSCIASSECCGSCPTGQTCSNGSCVSTITCKSEMESKGYKVIETAEDLIKYASTEDDLYVSGIIQTTENVTLKNVTLKHAYKIESKCRLASLLLKDVVFDGTVSLDIPFKASKIFNVNTSKTLELIATNDFTVDNILITSSAKSRNILNLSYSGEDTKIGQITVQSQNTRLQTVETEIIGGHSRSKPNIGTIIINGNASVQLLEYLDICSISLSNYVDAPLGPTLRLGDSSEMTASCDIPTSEPFISISQCGTVDKKCKMTFGTASSSSRASTVNFNNRSLAVSNAVATVTLYSTATNVSSWGVSSTTDTRYVTNFSSKISGLLQFTDNSSISGGSSCGFSITNYTAISNSSQINNIKTGQCTISSR